MKIEEVHKMKDAELVEEATRLRNRIFELKAQAVTEKLEDPKQIGLLKKDVARLLTEKRSREIVAANQENA